MRFRSVDLPALGLPRKDTKPDFTLLLILDQCRLSTTQPDLGNAPAFNFEDFNSEAIDVKPFAHIRHAPKMRQQVSADGLEAFAFDFGAQAVLHFVDTDLSAEHEDTVTFVHDGLALDVVLV